MSDKVYSWNDIQRVKYFIHRPWWKFWVCKEKLAVEWLEKYAR